MEFKGLIIITFLILVVLFLLFITSRKEEDIVIVSAHYKEKLDWLNDSPWKVSVCDKNGSDATSLPLDRSCYLDVNRGREASSYLKYIVENYDSLPKYVAFIHGHEDAEHQKYPGGILKAIRDAKKENFDYISLNNFIHLKSEDGNSRELPRHQNSHNFGEHKLVWAEMRNNWASVFEPILKQPLPEYFRFDCSAQFIVSRDAIRRNSKEAYQKLLDFMVAPDGNDWARGVALEFTWHSIMTGKSFDICNEENDDLYHSCTDEAYRRSRFK